MTATAAQIQQVTDAFRALQTSIPGILSFEQGVNNSPEAGPNMAGGRQSNVLNDFDPDDIEGYIASFA